MAANNFKLIALAMNQYAVNHDGRLPSATLCDAEGRPLLSWRVLLLPFLDEEKLYREFHLDEPWDSPHNRALLPRMPQVYGVPKGLPVDPDAEPFTTFCQLFVGRGTVFEGAAGLRLPDDFPDGTSNTLLLVEAGEAVPWTKPADVRFEAGQPLPPLGGMFTGKSRFSLFGPSRTWGINVAFADGSVRFIKPSPSVQEALPSLVLREGGDKTRAQELLWAH